MATPHSHEQNASISYGIVRCSWLTLCPLLTVDGQAHTQGSESGEVWPVLGYVLMNELYWGDSLGLRKNGRISHQYAFESSPGD